MEKKEDSNKKDSEASIKDYWPLIYLILVSFLTATAISSNVDGNMLAWMHYFMGFLFCQFSLLKLFDISGFADGFQMYDILAKRSRAYAVFYPFIELILGLSYFSFSLPVVTYIATIIFMTIGSIGVIQSLQKGLDMYCPCMGNVLKVPLSTVTLTEDLGMGVMALWMLYLY